MQGNNSIGPVVYLVMPKNVRLGNSSYFHIFAPSLLKVWKIVLNCVFSTDIFQYKHVKNKKFGRFITINPSKHHAQSDPHHSFYISMWFFSIGSLRMSLMFHEESTMPQCCFRKFSLYLIHLFSSIEQIRNKWYDSD